MKRRQFVGTLGIGSAALLAGGAAARGLAAPGAAADGGHEHEEVDGPLSSATVSFGQWMTEPPLDRFPDLSPRTANQHLLIPFEATIRSGGSVNFVISGFHHVLIYEPGTKLSDINAGLTVPPTNPPPGVALPPLINDPNGRVYRGLDPSRFPQDRVEVVTFAQPGRYLVVCGVLPHFTDNMHGFVRVLGRKR